MAISFGLLTSIIRRFLKKFNILIVLKGDSKKHYSNINIVKLDSLSHDIKLCDNICDDKILRRTLNFYTSSVLCLI